MLAVWLVFENLGQGVVAHQAADLVEELADRDLLARESCDPLVFSEDRRRRADGRDEEVGPANALRPEEVEPLSGNLSEFLANIVPQPVPAARVSSATYEKDG